jgi:LytR cell envelope-related transcriptional attenuator
MTDFVDDLERELVSAARRGNAHRRRLIPRPALKPLLAVATAVAAIVVIALAARPAPEREAPVATPGVAIPPAVAGRQPGPTDVLVLNETAVEGLAAATRDELVAELGIEAMVDARQPTRERSVVHAMSPADEPLARRIAAALRLPLDSAAIRPVSTPDGRPPRVVVLLGTDRTR